jgi:hypothetical protein
VARHAFGDDPEFKHELARAMAEETGRGWNARDAVSENIHDVRTTANVRTASLEPSEVLGASLEREGVGKAGLSEDWAHIVPAYMEDKGGHAARARGLIYEANIGLNDAINGIPLPSKDAHRDASRSVTQFLTAHEETHTPAFLRHVADRLQAVPPEERRAVLGSIQSDLAEGWQGWLQTEVPRQKAPRKPQQGPTVTEDKAISFHCDSRGKAIAVGVDAGTKTAVITDLDSGRQRTAQFSPRPGARYGLVADNDHLLQVEQPRSISGLPQSHQYRHSAPKHSVG